MNYNQVMSTNPDLRVVGDNGRYLLLDDSKEGTPGKLWVLFDTIQNLDVAHGPEDTHSARIAPGPNGNVFIFGTGTPLVVKVDTKVHWLPNPFEAGADNTAKEILEYLKKILVALTAPVV